jgi:hypothetical protein
MKKYLVHRRSHCCLKLSLNWCLCISEVGGVALGAQDLAIVLAEPDALGLLTVLAGGEQLAKVSAGDLSQVRPVWISIRPTTAEPTGDRRRGGHTRLNPLMVCALAREDLTYPLAPVPYAATLANDELGILSVLRASGDGGTIRALRGLRACPGQPLRTDWRVVDAPGRWGASFQRLIG